MDIILQEAKVNGIKEEIEKINKVKIVFIISYDSFAIQRVSNEYSRIFNETYRI